VPVDVVLDVAVEVEVFAAAFFASRLWKIRWKSPCFAGAVD
jgi:hypothetical protein